MKVKLLASTPNLLDVLYTSARTCYNAGSPIDMWKDLNKSKKDKVSLIFRCYDARHLSVLEHSQFTFAIEGITRACYDKDTEVLTDNGWKLFKDIDITKDRFATRNKNGEVEFERALNQTEYTYIGALHRYYSQNLDLMITPNHKLYVKKYDVRNNAEYELIASEELDKKRYYMTKDFRYNPTVSNIVKIKGYEYERKNRNGETYIKTLSDITLNKEHFLLLLAWYLSDGSTYYNKKENSFCISISQTPCKENIANKTRERITEILKNLNINSWMDKGGVSFKNLVIGKYFHSLGTCSEKKIPFNIFKEFNKYYAKLFIDEYFKGDGSIDINGCGKIYTTSKELSEQLYLLCFIAGYTCKITTQRPRGEHKIDNHIANSVKPCYVLNVTLSAKGRNKNIVVKRDTHFSLKSYDGKVYCVEVPNHTLFIRRNGIAIWCGNCSHQLVRHRLCAFSQQSQRYVEIKEDLQNLSNLYYSHDEEYNKMLDKYFVIPDNDKEDEDFTDILFDTLDTYLILIEKGYKPEDARAVLPNCTKTNLVMTCNLRELIHICNERMCTKAQKEIRQLVNAMAKEVIKEHCWLKPLLLPKCYVLKGCPEAKSCGRYKED